MAIGCTGDSAADSSTLAPLPHSIERTKQMARFVLVPGGWHGGWAFEAVSNALSSEGHEVQAQGAAGTQQLKVRLLAT